MKSINEVIDQLDGAAKVDDSKDEEFVRGMFADLGLDHDEVLQVALDRAKHVVPGTLSITLLTLLSGTWLDGVSVGILLERSRH